MRPRISYQPNHVTAGTALMLLGVLASACDGTHERPHTKSMLWQSLIRPKGLTAVKPARIWSSDHEDGLSRLTVCRDFGEYDNTNPFSCCNGDDRCKAGVGGFGGWREGVCPQPHREGSCELADDTFVRFYRYPQSPNTQTAEQAQASCVNVHGRWVESEVRP